MSELFPLLKLLSSGVRVNYLWAELSDVKCIPVGFKVSLEEFFTYFSKQIANVKCKHFVSQATGFKGQTEKQLNSGKIILKNPQKVYKIADFLWAQ